MASASYRCFRRLPAGRGPGQGVLGDVLSGPLVKPEVGQWAWYDLKDSGSEREYMFRQAIVGRERVGARKGYWLEIEIAPRVGHTSVYKMLVTRPTSDPGNIHRILLRQGRDPVVEIPVEEGVADVAGAPEPKRTSFGEQEVQTPGGTLLAEHVVLSTADGVVEMWLNDEVRPMGIVRMRGPHGELMLRSYGEGGENALSRLGALPGDTREIPGFGTGPKVEVEVVTEPAGAPDTKEAGPQDALNAPPKEDE